MLRFPRVTSGALVAALVFSTLTVGHDLAAPPPSFGQEPVEVGPWGNVTMSALADLGLTGSAATEWTLTPDGWTVVQEGTHTTWEKSVPWTASMTYSSVDSSGCTVDEEGSGTGSATVQVMLDTLPAPEDPNQPHEWRFRAIYTGEGSTQYDTALTFGGCREPSTGVGTQHACSLEVPDHAFGGIYQPIEAGTLEHEGFYMTGPDSLCGTQYDFQLITWDLNFPGNLPDVAVLKERIDPAPPADLNVGDVVTYSLTVSNVGARTADDVTVTDIPPYGLTLISIESPGQVCANFGCDLGDLEPGESIIVTAKMSVEREAAGLTMTNVATVATSSGETSLANNESASSDFVSPGECDSPTAMFTAQWVYGAGPSDTTETFNGASSSPGFGATLVSWEWEFGDGARGASIATQHEYGHYGEYDVTLTVTNSCGESDSITNTVAVNAPHTYAPVVYLHPGEDYFPMRAADFIANSTLTWYSLGCGTTRFGSPPIASSLAAGGYAVSAYGQKPRVPRVPPQLDCTERLRPYASNELTRPFDNPELGQQGFALDLDDRFVSGGSLSRPGRFDATVPVYFQYAQEDFVVYWFHYGYSVPVGKYRLDGPTALSHEGDWEHVVVHLGGGFDVKSAMTYYYHHWHTRFDWEDVVIDHDLHPRVLAARYGHGSYWTINCDFVDGHATGDVCDLGPRWPAEDVLVDVTREPWYGYGGGWGKGGSEPDFTGPLGPSPFKDPLGDG